MPSWPRRTHRPAAGSSRSGPGLGLLTAGLLSAGAAVTAVELDRALAAFLRERFEGVESLRLIEGDALDQDLVHLVEPPYDVVANLPYHITSPILHALLGSPPRPERLVLMVQREVAERIAAPPGKMSYLSVFVQYHARVRIAFTVPAAAFEPEPAVESAVIVVEPYAADDRLDPATEDELWRLVQAAFRERRKMIHNVLSRQLPLDAGRVTAALATAGIDPDRRPQTLAVGEWLALHAALGPIGPDGRGRRAPRDRRDRRDPMTAVQDPLRRLSPVVRLAPAKLNLTLAVVGRREDGYHTLHSVFVPLTLADRLSLAPLGGDRDTLHVSGLDAGPPARQPRVPRAGGRPGSGRWRLGGRTRSGTGPRRPARQADPGRGRAGRWILGRRGDPRRRDRGVGRRAGRARPSRGRRPSRLGCAVLPGRRSRARRGARGTGRAAPRPPRSTRASCWSRR